MRNKNERTPANDETCIMNRKKKKAMCGGTLNMKFYELTFLTHVAYVFF